MQARVTALPHHEAHTTPQRPGDRSLASYAVLPPPLPEIGMRSIPGVTGKFRTVSPYPLPLPDGTVVIIPEGFESDLASVPRVLWGKVGPHELGFLAPVGHDYLLHLRSLGQTHLTREQIDDVFDALMERQRVALRLRVQSAWAVRLWTRIERRRDAIWMASVAGQEGPARAALGVVMPTVLPALVGWRVGLVIEVARLGLKLWRDVKKIRTAREAQPTAPENTALMIVQPQANLFRPGLLRRIAARLLGKTPKTPKTPKTVEAPPQEPTFQINLRRWREAKIRPDWVSRVKDATLRVKANERRYRIVAAQTGVPWPVIGVLHLMECNCDFNKHLHNGDPLTARTVRVPAGRPESGMPPFTWEESAIDALRYDRLDKVASWDLNSMLDAIERYNGFGYRRRGIPSPYLWSGTTVYEGGKFVRDGVYDPHAISKQVGAAAVLKQLGFE